MIQQQYKNNVQDISGDIQTTGFNIEVNESMFQMLTSNVYNDPILAVMREWSTNACDACIAAGKDVNFDVHLPTLEAPTFYVRDYGTGLPPEDIVGLFSNLGASTKRNSDAYNGTLGIGRMAGLAVGEAFTVESYYNGKKYSYAISMQNGVPVTLHLGDDETSEPNGLKLSVAVELGDIGSYNDRAYDLYKYFDHKPTLNRDMSVELDVSEHISDDWFITKSQGSYRESNYVVMSQVAYEIPYSGEVETFGFRNLVIKAKPGAVTFNPGRESLSLNKATVKYLNDAFERISNEYVEAAKDAMEATANDFELMKTFNSLIRSAPHQVAAKINPEEYASDQFKGLFGTRSYYYSGGTSDFNYLSMGAGFTDLTDNLVSISFKNSYYKTSKTLDSENSQQWREFFFSPHVIIDLKSNFRSQLNEHYTGRSLVTWQRKSKVDIDDAVDAAKEYLDAMGIPYTLASEIIEASDFEGIKKAPREGLYASKVAGNDVLKSEKMEEWEATNSTYLYLKLKNTTPVLSDDSMTFTDYQVVYNMLCQVTTMPLVRGVAKKYQDFVGQLDNWVDYETYIKDKMKEVTFIVPLKGEIPVLSSSYINDGVYKDYPQDLQDLYLELKQYNKFNSAANYLHFPYQIELAEKMNANFESYVPTKSIDLECLEAKYPKTMEMITGRGYHYGIEADFVVHLAKLEEFYAVHSSE